MPLTAKGEEIKSALEKEYGGKAGERILYAGKNKGTFTGIDAEEKRSEKTNRPVDLPNPWPSGNPMRPRPDSSTMTRLADAINNLQQRFDAMCSRGDERKPEDKVALPPINSDPRLAPYNVRKPSEAKPPGQNPKV